MKDNKKKVLINAICYNNFSDIERFLDSLDYSPTNYQLNIVNNGKSIPKDIISRLSDFDNIKIISGHGNVGYFPGAKLGLDSVIETSDFDTMIVCNLDLTVDSEFFVNLNSYRGQSVLAPSIYSEFEKRDRNPKVLKKYSKEKINNIVRFYSIPMLSTIYKKLFYKFYKAKKRVEYDNGFKIYAPHGSFIVFDCDSSLWNEFLSYPVFLFGEEIFVAEIAKKYNQPVVYAKNLLVIDRDHASTGLEGERFFRLNNLNAMKFLKNEFWS